MFVSGSGSKRSQIAHAFIAAAAVLAGSLLAAEVEQAEGDGPTARGMSEIPAAPAPIVGVEAPRVDGEDWSAVEFVIPVRRAGELVLPEPPTIDVDTWREKVRPWLGDGVMAAPTQGIEVEAPPAGDGLGLDGPKLDPPSLERPELPAPPPVR